MNSEFIFQKLAFFPYLENSLAAATTEAGDINE